MKVGKDMNIDSVDKALDVLDDFMDDLDELYGLCTFTYGDDAYEAMEFLHMWRLEEIKKKIQVG